MVVVVGQNYNTGYLDGVEMYNRIYNFGNSYYSQFFEDAVVHEKLWLGRAYWDQTNQYFDGTIDELRIFDRDLTQSEVIELYGDTITTDIPYIENADNIGVYPNPASDKLFINIPDINNESYVIRLYDITGNLLLSGKINGNRYSADTSALSDGMYFLELDNNNEIYRKKIIVK